MPAATSATLPAIVQILRVQDTRDFEEQGDRSVPVPGSGQPRPCDRCGRDHEIHVDVQLSDGSTARIGQGCARGDAMAAAIRTCVSLETTRARLARAHARATADLRAAERAWSAVAAQTPPDAVLLEERPDTHGVVQIWGMGDARVWTLPGRPFDLERRSALLHGWRTRRLGPAQDDLVTLRHRVAALVKQLDKAEQKLRRSTSSPGREHEARERAS